MRNYAGNFRRMPAAALLGMALAGCGGGTAPPAPQKSVHENLADTTHNYLARQLREKYGEELAKKFDQDKKNNVFRYSLPAALEGGKVAVFVFKGGEDIFGRVYVDKQGKPLAYELEEWDSFLYSGGMKAGEAGSYLEKKFKGVEEARGEKPKGKGWLDGLFGGFFKK